MVLVPSSTNQSIKLGIRVILALAAMLIAAGIPGLFGLNISSRNKLLAIQITGALIVFLIVLAVHPNPNETAAAIEVTLLFLAPFLIRHVYKRFEMHPSTPSLALLSVLVIMTEAAFFSQIAGSMILTLPPEYPQETGAFNEIYLRGASRAACKDTSCHQNLRALSGTAVRKRADSSDKQDELHILLDVEWNKWEGPFDLFSRNYRGYMYFIVKYGCTGDHLEFYGSSLDDYSLRPGKAFSSWLIGFVEIPFSLDDSTVRRAVEKRAQEVLLECPL
jgi:hypothetical protein